MDLPAFAIGRQIYIMPILLMSDLSTLYLVDYLWQTKTEKVHQGVKVWILPTHQVKYSIWWEDSVHRNELFKKYSFLFLLWKTNHRNQTWFSSKKLLWCYQVVLIWFLVKITYNNMLRQGPIFISKKNPVSIKNAYARTNLGMWHIISWFFKSYCKGIFLSIFDFVACLYLILSNKTGIPPDWGSPK